METIKRCKYENCNNVIFGKDGKLFCSKNCRSHYWTYERRRIKRLKSEKDKWKKMISDIQLKLSDKELELYNKLYN